MEETFATVLAVGGRSNSLGRVDEVVAEVVAGPARLPELYDCLSGPDAWVRMRAADALEKVCRERPVWFGPYVDRWFDDHGDDSQASLQWHLAQILRQVELTPSQTRRAATWLAGLLATTDVDWIVSANAMETLTELTRRGAFPQERLAALLAVQQGHHSTSVVRRAAKLLAALPADT